MMNSKLRTLITALVIGVTGFGCQSSDKLAPIQKLYLASAGTADMAATFCLKDPAASKQKLKILFVMDKSSSNQNPPDSSDPDGTRRYASLINLLDTAETDENTYYGLVNFSTGATTTQSFTNDLLGFRGLIRAQWNGTGNDASPAPVDIGETDYLGALQAAKAEIERDLIATIDSFQDRDTVSRYLIIMVSDGFPIVDGVAQLPSSIERLILPQYASSILSLKEDPKYRKYLEDIVVHAGYYHSGATFDLDARDLLENISIWGGGTFSIFGAGTAVDYSLFALPPRRVRYLLSDVIVENLSTAWADDGEHQLDTDGDGLSDHAEDRFGSNKDLVDTDGNGVSDFVEFRSKGRPCNDLACSSVPDRRDNYVGCQGMIVSTINGRVAYPDSDGDALNDCEEWILRSDRWIFDSNDDHLPDGAAFRQGLQFIAGASDSQADPDNDGLTNLEELKRGTPLRTPNRSVLNLKPANYELHRIESTPDAHCYSMTTRNLPTLGVGNLIRISVIQNQAAVENRSVLISATGRVETKSNRLVIPESAFK